MASVFEPIADLRGRESRRLGQFPFLGGIRVRILEVPLSEQAPGALLEAVRLLLTVPDGPGQRELLADAVLVDGSERSPAQLLGFQVVSLEPHGLQFAVRVFGEPVRLDDVVELAVVAHVVGDQGPGSQHRLGLVQLANVRMGHRQRPEEPAQSLNVAALLQRLANGRHLADAEIQRRERRWWRDQSSSSTTTSSASTSTCATSWKERSRHEWKSRLIRRCCR